MRLVAYLVHVTGACKGILVHQAEAFQLILIIILLGVHKFIKNQILQEICGYIFVKRARIYGKFLLGAYTCIQNLLHQIIYGCHNFEAKGCHEMIILRCDRYKLLGLKGIAVHHQRFHDFGKRFSLFSIEDRLLFFR